MTKKEKNNVVKILTSLTIAPTLKEIVKISTMVISYRGLKKADSLNTRTHLNLIFIIYY